ncbi:MULTISPECIES: DNA circularization protein [unclassified Pseudomonas]|uniref:DNA circularization protein n=1 Tax=unclassified Pseudomonas TaxID=196821 RepID=UPI0011AA928D|nr:MULTISPECIES: DNA circularization N-terminal domain-containing protein [unclassified Pseudomonas]TWC21113.1 prophage DNA circulation protein [Pseudomonas sp. SJZ075]TWC36593.1 prophage DNA circulation protein [Pseudomonas sp. SJZ078]TWC57352.1 prophage DNA circulation protein [Pseudomonas sp. SJZ124]TWC92351.1 prophage DNA circulation protein [Pseudomonas sp. SJZ101]
MSWKENLLDASFRGVPLDVAGENLQAQWFTGQHGTPYKQGDSAEDMGRGGRVFALRVIFNGPNYEFELKALLDALDVLGPGELVHPIYGSVTVVTQTLDVQHTAERPDYAEVALQFLECSPDEPFFDRDLVWTLVKSGYAEDETTWQDGVFDLLAKVDSLVTEIQSWIGGGWTGFMEKALGLPGIGLRLQQLRSQIMGVVSQVVSMATSNPLAAFDPLVDLARTPTEIRAVIQNSTPSTSRELLSRRGVPSTVPGSTSLTTEASRAGTELFVSARQGTEPDAALIPESMPADPVEAASLALVVLIVTETALANAQAVAAIIEDEATTQTLSPDDLESLVNLSRSLLESTILLHRRLYDVEAALPVIDALRTMAALIQARARSVILLSPPLIERAVESAANLRLLAHRWYGDHSRAIELARLNPSLSAPYDIQPGEVLRAYAK